MKTAADGARAGDEIVVRGRTFRVEAGSSSSMPWLLHGKRGAVYGTFRNIPTGLLFLAGVNARLSCAGMQDVRLSDDDGALRVVRS